MSSKGKHASWVVETEIKENAFCENEIWTPVLGGDSYSMNGTSEESPGATQGSAPVETRLALGSPVGTVFCFFFCFVFLLSSYYPDFWTAAGQLNLGVKW